MQQGNVDYHIHYFIDKCARDEMTLKNIEQISHELGLTEICVLKHYCHQLPNDKDEFITWYHIKEEEFEYFLKDFASYQQKYDIQMFSGVETELLDEEGRINIPTQQSKRVDSIALSCHWLPNLNVLPMDLMVYPDPDFYTTEDEQQHALQEVVKWKEKIASVPTEDIITGYINAYVNAIESHDKIKTLSHMYDGCYPLDLYHVPVDSIEKDKLIQLMQPLFQICAKKNVLWELLATPVKRPYLLQAAAKHGVHFCASSDSHMIQNGWGNLIDHHKAEAYIDSLGLPKGKINMTQ